MSDDWMAQAERELAGAAEAWQTGNAGRGRVGARRAAGMAIKARLAVDDREGYGKTFMHHLNAMADDPSIESSVREAAWRLAARDAPAAGFEVEVPAKLTPMHDAQIIMHWAEIGLD